MELKMKPISTIKTRLQIQPKGKVHKYFTQRCAYYMEKYAPYREGHLIANKNVDIEVDKITYLSKYAHYQYVGKLYVDPIYKKGAFYKKGYGFWSRPKVIKIKTSRDLKHTRGYSKWDKKMWSVEKETIEREVTNYAKRIGGK